MKYLSLVLVIIVSVNCTNQNSLENTHTHFQLESGNLMSDISEDFLGNSLEYPEGDPSLTTSVAVWESGFVSPWHYHPFTGSATILQGELTVDFDTTTNVNDIDSDKVSSMRKTFKAGEAIMAIQNVWHQASNQGEEQLIFMVSWIGEKGKPVVKQ
jgi:quercetin dioxygenase-like cupin family protein